MRGIEAPSTRAFAANMISVRTLIESTSASDTPAPIAMPSISSSWSGSKAAMASAYRIASAVTCCQSQVA
ncbi:unannotated protein [freshwater metagenome]|uniref:Unannotated protein n=1 Tax=freshwater metagenome TaxID=449393 RepID=A0A6J7KRL8_9ZZZZ